MSFVFGVTTDTIAEEAMSNPMNIPPYTGWAHLRTRRGLLNIGDGETIVTLNPDGTVFGQPEGVGTGISGIVKWNGQYVAVYMKGDCLDGPPSPYKVGVSVSTDLQNWTVLDVESVLCPASRLYGPAPIVVDSRLFVAVPYNESVDELQAEPLHTYGMELYEPDGIDLLTAHWTHRLVIVGAGDSDIYDPVFLTASDGRLWEAAQFHDNQLHVRHLDGGATALLAGTWSPWSPSLAEAGEVGYGRNPRLMELPDGTIRMYYTWGDSGEDAEALGWGNHVYHYVDTEDDGLTWTAPREVPIVGGELIDDSEWWIDAKALLLASRETTAEIQAVLDNIENGWMLPVKVASITADQPNESSVGTEAGQASWANLELGEGWGWTLAPGAAKSVDLLEGQESAPLEIATLELAASIPDGSSIIGCEVALIGSVETDGEDILVTPEMKVWDGEEAVGTWPVVSPKPFGGFCHVLNLWQGRTIGDSDCLGGIADASSLAWWQAEGRTITLSVVANAAVKFAARHFTARLYYTEGTAMTPGGWDTLRTRIRTEIRDTTATYVFTDAELLNYLKTALAIYGRRIPMEVSETLALVAGQADYALPAGCIRIESIKVGTTPLTVSDIYGDTFTIDPAPIESASAVMRYTADHTVPVENSDLLTFASRDEDIIVKLVRSEVCKTLAEDGARYYRYREGDIEEDQGKTQDQYAKTSAALTNEALAELEEAVKMSKRLRPSGAGVSRARLASKPLPSRSTTITREFQ